VHCAIVSGFLDLINQSAYGAICDGQTFWQNRNTPKYREEIDTYPTYVYQNMVVLQTLLYLCLYPFELWILTVPWLGLFWRTLIFCLIDLPKFYSIANLIYWHNHGSSSPIISALIPRDPYTQMKRFVGIIVDILPPELGYILRFDLILPFFSDFLIHVSNLLRHQQQIKEQPQDSKNPPKNQWSEEILNPEFKHQFEDFPDHAMVIQAVTGSGKSTALNAALDQRTYATGNGYKLPGGKSIERHILLVPSRLLRDEWSSPFSDNVSLDATMTSLKVSRKTSREAFQKALLQRHKILIMTYGHFLNRPELHHPHIKENTVYYFDEFHMFQGEQIAAYEVLQQHPNLGKIIFLSATPQKLEWAKTTNYVASLKRRFTGRRYIRDARDPTQNYEWAQQQFPEHARPENTLIIVPTIAEVTAVRQRMAEIQIPTQEISRRTQGTPINPSNMLIATQIADAGVNLPNRHLYIGTGTEFKNIRGNLVIESSSPITAIQRDGRVARTAPLKSGSDISIVPSWDGTGRTAISYPAPNYFMYDLVCKHHKVLQLIEAQIEGFKTYERYPYIHLNTRSYHMDESTCDTLILYTLLQQTVTDLSTLGKKLTDLLSAINSGNSSIIGEELEHLYLFGQTLKPRTMTAKDCEELINRPNSILYSIKFSKQYPCPEAPRIDIATLTELPSWDGVLEDSIQYFHVKTLSVKEGRWLNRESTTVQREFIKDDDIKTKVINDQLRTLDEFYNRLCSKKHSSQNNLRKHQQKRRSEILHQYDDPTITPFTHFDPYSDDGKLTIVQQSLRCSICGSSSDHEHTTLSDDEHLKLLKIDTQLKPGFTNYQLCFVNPFFNPLLKEDKGKSPET